MTSLGEDRSVLSRSVAGPTSMISYGPHSDQVIEEWLPVDDWTMVEPITVVLMHGGFWEQQYDRRHCRPLAVALADKGMRVLLPEYRRVGGAGGWPNTLGDARTATEHIMTGEPAGRVVMVGHSAGGQLALWIAASHPPVGLTSVVGLAPVCDLAGAHSLGLGVGAVDRLMGGSPAALPERYASADPLQLASPVPPTTVVHGFSDSVVPVAMSHRYAEVHRSVDLIERPCGHFELIDPLTSEFDVLLSVIKGD